MIVSSIVPMALLTGNALAYDTPHAPIAINGDADFAAQAAAEGWAGDGSEGNPYVIAGYQIDTTGAIGISIQNTRVHFTIQSCLLYSYPGPFNGVYLYNVWNADLNQVVSEANLNGLYAWQCNWINITGGGTDPYVYGLPDYSYNTGKGIYLNKVDNCTIIGVSNWYNLYNLYAAGCNNLLLSGGDYTWSFGTGAYLGGCKEVTITGGLFNWNGWNGLDVRSSTNVGIDTITATGNVMNGFNLRSNNHVTISGSSFTSNSQSGIYGYLCNDTTASSVTCDDNTKGGLYLLSCTNSLVSESIMTFARNGWNGITLSSCNAARIETCVLEQNSNGISIISSSGVYVNDTYSNSNDLSGIFIQSSNGVTLSDVNDYNDMSGNFKNGMNAVGSRNITLSGGAYDNNIWHGVYMISCPSDIILDGVSASTNGYNGIHLASTPNAIVSDAYVYGNAWNGIYVKSSNGAQVTGSTSEYNMMSGMYIVLSNGMSIINSASQYNTRDGIYLGSCTDPTVDTTTSSNNGWYGVKALGSNNVQVVDCTLDANTQGAFYWPNAAPLASFGVKRIDTIAEPTVLNASASYDLDGTITSYNWEYGDGTTGSTGSAVSTHQYAAMRNYVINLTVRDNDGRSSTKVSKQLALQTDLCAKIVVADRAAVGDTISLDASHSYSLNEARTLTAFEWDFGDLSPKAYGVSQSHSWSTAGRYTVTLRVQDDIGRWSPIMTATVKVGSASVVALSVSASRHSLLPNEEVLVTIKAVDGAGNKVSGCTDTVDVSANRSGLGWTGLPVSVALVDGEVTLALSCSNSADYNITAVDQSDSSITGSEFVTVADSTVEIRVYDFMQLTLGTDFGARLSENYWYPTWRGKWGDQPYRYEAPAYHLYATGSNKLQSNIDTTYRVGVEARNLLDVNLATDPTFFPKMNAGTGGVMSFTWDYNYMNETEFWYWNLNNKPPMPPKNYYPPGTPGGSEFSWSRDDQNRTFTADFTMYSQDQSAYDGWETFITINVTMDRDAAWQLIGLPTGEGDVARWWTYYDLDDGDRHGNNDTVKTYWESNFMRAEGGGGTLAGRLDIKSCDDGFPWEGGFWGSYYRLWDNGDGTVSMRIWRVGYGEDTLLARWLYWGGVSNGWNYPNGTPGGIMPFEPYYDDFHMVGGMDDTSADIAFDAGIIYGFRAFKSKDPGVSADTAVWRWEEVRLDYGESSGDGTWNRSEMDIYAKNSRTFDIWDPAGTSFGITIAADQTPTIAYLGIGQSLIFEKSRIPVSGIMGYPLVGDDTQMGDRDLSGYNNWIGILEKWGYPSIHPLGCYPGTSVIDAGTGDLAIVGPFWPIVQYYSDMPWLHKESAPLIEYWIE